MFGFTVLAKRIVFEGIVKNISEASGVQKSQNLRHELLCGTRFRL